MPRFVILEHDHPQGKHWDFMLEADGVLKTWSLASLPQAEEEMECRALPDHRLAYLDYEGEVSGGRGNVTRVDEGQYAAAHSSVTEWIIRLSGGKLSGRVELRRVGPEASQWRFTWRTGQT